MENSQTSGMPDYYDRSIGLLEGLTGTTWTKPTTERATDPILGNAQTFIIQTVRQKDEKEGDEDDKSVTRAARFTVFLEYVGKEGSFRIVLPPKVSDVIDRQRTALSDRARSKTAKRAAATRKERGIVPGFLKNPGKRKK